MSMIDGDTIVAATVVTKARIVERGFPTGPCDFELVMEREDGKCVSVGVATLHRVREILAELGFPRIEVWCSRDEDADQLLAQVTTGAPLLH